MADVVRAPIRDAWWELRGLTIRNPPLPAAPRSWLFICKGNICRSPFAARLANRLLDRSGAPGQSCRSAGLEVSKDDGSPRLAIEAAAAYDVSLTEHRPAALNEAMIERADVVVVMEATHLARLRRVYPTHTARFFLLPLYVSRAAARRGYFRFNITDPYGRPKQAFEDCYSQIHAALQQMLTATLSPRPGPATGPFRPPES